MKKVLEEPEKYLKSIADYFAAYMINKRARFYGFELVSPKFLSKFKNIKSLKV